MKILRFETEDTREGIYRREVSGDILSADGDGRQPIPGEDGIPYPGADAYSYLFGFEDRRQALAWFLERELRAVWEASKGRLVAAVYDAPDEWVLKGGHQVAFHSKHARRIAAHPIPEFLNERSEERA